MQTYIHHQNHFSGSYIIQASAALITYHYTRTRMPYPDLITSFPNSRYKKMASGPSTSERLAKELSLFLRVPCLNLIQTNLINDHFKLKKPDQIEDKNVLLVKDTLSDDFFRAGEALAEGFPRRILGATLLRDFHT